MNFKRRKPANWVVRIQSDETFDSHGFMHAIMSAETTFRCWYEDDCQPAAWRVLARGWSELIELLFLLRNYAENYEVMSENSEPIDLELLHDEIERAGGPPFTFPNLKHDNN